MARPTTSATTERIYDRLPECYRTADPEQAAPDYPLLRYLSLAGDQLDELATIVDRIDYRAADEDGAPGDTSDLVDPDTADPAWLPWLAQLVGVRLNPYLDDAGKRQSIKGSVAGTRAGTRDAIAEAARSALTGGQYVNVYPDKADPWRIYVATIETETPGGPSSVIDAVIAAHAKPAAFELVHTFYAATWDLIETTYPTWADLEAAGSWAAITSTQ